MSPSSSRRELLTVASTLLLANAGCVGSDSGSQSTMTDDTSSTSTSGTERPEEQVERLPEPSPLSNTLRNLVLADDRRQFAEEHGISYREGAVKVQIELVDGGETPEQHFTEVTGSYDSVAVGYVRTGDLVPLALEDSVRIVRSPPESRPG